MKGERDHLRGRRRRNGFRLGPERPSFGVHALSRSPPSTEGKGCLEVELETRETSGRGPIGDAPAGRIVVISSTVASLLVVGVSPFGKAPRLPLARAAVPAVHAGPPGVGLEGSRDPLAPAGLPGATRRSKCILWKRSPDNFAFARPWPRPPPSSAADPSRAIKAGTSRAALNGLTKFTPPSETHGRNDGFKSRSLAHSLSCPLICES